MILIVFILFIVGTCEIRAIQGSLGPQATALSFSSVNLLFNKFESSVEEDIVAYEISYRSMFNTAWQIYSSNLGSTGNNISVSQIVSVRVDQDATVPSDAAFILAEDRTGLIADDFQHLSRTPLIPYNANSAAFNVALNFIKNIAVREVKRCDEFGEPYDSPTGHGGELDWSFGCPYLLQGGYRWLIVFDIPETPWSVPKLLVYRSQEFGTTWTGPGNQISVSTINMGSVNPATCGKSSLCQTTITGLDAGTPYSFRVRALSASYGWTDYSPTSGFVTTMENSIPSRPKPPTFSVASDSSITLQLVPPLSIQGVLVIESQFQIQISSSTGLHAGPQSKWINGPIFNVTQVNGMFRNLFVLPVAGLQAQSTYIFRTRLLNSVGYSPYSMPSDAFTTAVDNSMAIMPTAPVVNYENNNYAVQANSVELLITSVATPNIPLGSVSFKLQYRNELEQNWHSVSTPVVFDSRSEGVAVQEVFTRANSPAVCTGQFWLRLGTTDPTNIYDTVSTPLAFDASFSDVQAAIMAIGVVKAAQPRVTVTRFTNIFNGFTWHVEIQGMGDVTRLQLYRHTLMAPSHGNQTLPCWSGADPIVSSTIQHGNDQFRNISKVVNVKGLRPKTLYHFRVVLMNSDGSFGLASNDTTAMTVAVDLPTSSTMAGLWAPRDDAMIAIGPSETVGGNGQNAAKLTDFHYLAGAGMGGLSGFAGSAGSCVAILYNPQKQEPYQTKYFYYTGGLQTFQINPSTVGNGGIVLVTLKCWGGGGGGGKVSDLTTASADTLSALSIGGGAAFAQISLHVYQFDQLNIYVGGGGQGPDGVKGGAGGFGGGGNGGSGLDGAGGGGGGVSYVTRGAASTEVLLAAAGGAGGGSTDYCCAHGGSGGAALPSSESDGSSPQDKTPWPLASLAKPTPVQRRFEYTASACPVGLAGDFCISQWDILPQSLPAEHVHLQYGESPGANFSIWAMPGLGASASMGGASGESGSFVVRTTGDSNTLIFDNQVAVFSQTPGLNIVAGNGYFLHGGSGAGGKEGGGGGGGGLWGGGGGGSGIDAGGGGGGCSFVNMSALGMTQKLLLSATIPAPTMTFVNDTQASFTWQLNWDNSLWGAAYRYFVEISYGPNSEDFSLLENVAGGVPLMSNNNTLFVTYTAQNLQPQTTYSFRVIPMFSKGRGAPSLPLVIQTLASTFNYWEPIISRRISLSATGRGFTNPVLQRPHLTPGVEIFGQRVSDNALRYTDPTTSETPAGPSGRRGHSLSTIDSFVYMFGGRTDGYSCASVYKDLVDLGTAQSGRAAYPCTAFQSEVQELWSFDIHTYEWVFINTSTWLSAPPPPREQHVAAVIGGNLFIFGGKSRIFPSNADGTPRLGWDHRADIAHNDLWMLTIQHASHFVLQWSNVSSLLIPEDRRLFISLNGSTNMDKMQEGGGVNAREGMCIDHLVITVVVRHVCISQLRLSVMGPGPETGSPNFAPQSSAHEILLYNQIKTNGTGCVGGTQTFIFDDSATTLVDQCCTAGYSGAYKPEGRLSEFIGAPTTAQWTLVAQDMKQDTLTGAVIRWAIDFTVSPCVKSFTWNNLTASANAKSSHWPSARHASTAIAFDRYLFVYGGRDANDLALQDLHRYDTRQHVWQQLQAVHFNTALNTYSSIGASFMLTAWGVLRFGGYTRQPVMSSSGGSYVRDVFMMDPVTLRWRQVALREWPMSDAASGALLPDGRYLSATTFVSSNQLSWHKTYSYRNLYDELLPSTRANYAGQLTDSVLMFGGHNGATGSMVDGSSGGMLKDLWMMRLTNWSTQGVRSSQQSYLHQNCAWRLATNITSGASLYSCLGGLNSACQLRDLLMMAWCSSGNQTMS